MSELSQGTKVESEHKGTVKFITEYVKKHGKLPPDKDIYRSIAGEHVGELKDYYTRLAEMEDQAEAEKTKTMEKPLKKAFIKIHDNLYLSMKKARVTKFIKKIPKPSGKGFYYFYNKADLKKYQDSQPKPGAKKGGILSGIMSFFGMKDEKQAKEKVGEVYSQNKSDFKGVDLGTFTNYMNEYLMNKDKWDAKFAKKLSEKKEAAPKSESAKSEAKGEKKPSTAQKWNMSLMKKIAGVVSGGSGESAENFDTMPEAEGGGLNNKFTHHSWFKGEGKTKAEAIDYFAKTGDFYLSKKPSKTQTDNLMDDVIYDDILKYSGKEGGTYNVSPEEKSYFLERQNFWKDQKEKDVKNKNKEKIDADEKFNQDFRPMESLGKYLSTHSKEFGEKNYKIQKENEKIAKKLFNQEKKNIITKKDYDDFYDKYRKEVSDFWGDESKNIFTGETAGKMSLSKINEILEQNSGDKSTAADKVKEKLEAAEGETVSEGNDRRLKERFKGNSTEELKKIEKELDDKGAQISTEDGEKVRDVNSEIYRREQEAKEKENFDTMPESKGENDFTEMTKKEYGEYKKRELDKYKVPTAKGIKDLGGIAASSEYIRQKEYFKDWKKDHRDIIAIALKEGKKVSEEVLKDYPDLKKKYGLGDKGTVGADAGGGKDSGEAGGIYDAGAEKLSYDRIKTKNIKDANEREVFKVLKPKNMINDNLRDSRSLFSYSSEGQAEGVWTDGQAMILDKNTSDEIYNTNKQREFLRQKKSDPGDSDEEILRNITSRGNGAFPEYKRVIPEDSIISKKEAKFTGKYDESADAKPLEFSDGESTAFLNANYVASLRSKFPDAAIHLSGETSPAVFKVGNEIKAILQPINVNKTEREWKNIGDEPLQKASHPGVRLLLDALEKGKKVPVGTVSGKMKKVAEGKWVPVSGEKKPTKEWDQKPVKGGKADGKAPKKINGGDSKKKDDKPKANGKEDKKDEKTGGLDESQRTTIKSALKKVASILADALSGKDSVAPAAGAVEQTGENIKQKGKEMSKKKENKPKTAKPKGE